MKFSTIIIGGGLSGLTAGITLAEQGQRVAVLAAGQSRLHFTSGSMELLGYNAKGEQVDCPLDECRSLPASHPYQKIGVENLASYAQMAKKLFANAGIEVVGDETMNHIRLSPIGVLKPAWLTLGDYITANMARQFPFQSVLIANIAGYIDMPTPFLKSAFEKCGVKCRVVEVKTPMLENLRRSQTEMRATNIARVLSEQSAVDQLSVEINRSVNREQAILIPAVMGITDNSIVQYLRRMVTRPLFCIATLPPAVTGVRLQSRLRKYFLSLGGTYMLGSTVREANISSGKILSVAAANLPDQKLKANNYILATGSFMGNGLIATQSGVIEPIMNLDVDAPLDRELWTAENLNESQPYMEFGVKTALGLHPSIDGKTITNLWAVGAVLSGHNPIKLADSSGVDMLTALHAATEIIQTEKNR